MSIDEKIRLGMLALAVASTVVAVVHFGHVPQASNPLLDVLGGIGSS